MTEKEKEKNQPIDSARFIVSDMSKAIKPGFFRVWFNDGFGTTTGWREIPLSRKQEAESFQDEFEKDGNIFYQDFDFSLTQGI